VTSDYLLDTDICIYISRNRTPSVTRRLAVLEPGSAVMSVICYGELRHGAEKSVTRERAMRRLVELTALLPVEPLPPAAGEAYGTIRADLERRGTVIGSNDLWIAAHALAADLTLVTNNEREFRRVPGLKVENWAAG
jgi:tRNA(fMet)-specific endonuclease VapC